MQTEQPLRWDDLRVVLALHRGGSLKHAAKALGINISTVSRRLDALEETIGMLLFDRGPDGTRPTLAAEQLLPHAETMEQAAHAFRRGLENFELEPEGTVRITAPPGFVDHFLAAPIAQLLDDHPRLRIEIISTIGYANLSRHEADIALRAFRPQAGDFVATRLTATPWSILASPAHAKALGRLRDPNKTRWVTWGDDLVHLSDARWLATHVQPEQVVFRSSSMTAQIEAVRAGIGAMLGPAPYGTLPGLATVACTPRLRTQVAQLPQGELWLVGHRALRHVPRIATVWEWLKHHFTTQPH